MGRRPLLCASDFEADISAGETFTSMRQKRFLYAEDAAVDSFFILRLYFLMRTRTSASVLESRSASACLRLAWSAFSGPLNGDGFFSATLGSGLAFLASLGTYTVNLTAIPRTTTSWGRDRHCMLWCPDLARRY